MKKQKRWGLCLLLAIVLLSGCKKTIDDYPLANLRAIVSFNFDYYHNSDCGVYIQMEGVVDEVNRVVTVSVPADADLTRLRPTIVLSPWTTCSPKNLQAVDFSDGPVEYEVTAQSGKKAYYTVTVTPDYVYQDASMVRLVLSDIPVSPDVQPDPLDPTSGLSGTPDKYSDGAVLDIFLPQGWGGIYNMSAQRTHIDMSASSHGCTIEVDDNGAGYRAFADMDVIDYTSPVVFRITSQSGKVVRYTVTVKEKEEL